ncbi:hypothetical protein RHS03_07940, partial [Rhizoctonia solani]
MATGEPQRAEDYVRYSTEERRSLVTSATLRDSANNAPSTTFVCDFAFQDLSAIPVEDTSHHSWLSATPILRSGRSQSWVARPTHPGHLWRPPGSPTRTASRTMIHLWP